MASFAPALDNSKTQDFTGSSKGVKADTSAGAALESAAEILNAGVKGMKSIFNEVIRADVTRAVDPIQDMFTGNGPAPGEAIDGKPQTPDEILRKGERLKTLSDGAKSGAIPMSYYLMMLDTEAKRLRTQYPGHREEVDNIMSDLTGGVPANRLITTLMQEAKEKGSKKDEAAKERQKELDFARSHGTPEVAGWVASGKIGQVSTEQLYAANLAFQARKADVAVRSSELSLNRANEEWQQNKALENINVAQEGMIQDKVRMMMAQGDSSYEKLRATAARIETAQANGKAPSKEDEIAIQALASQVKTELQEARNKFMTTPQRDSSGAAFTYADFLKDPQKRKQLDDAWNARVDDITKRFNDPTYIGANARIAEINKQNGLNEMLAKNPELGVTQAFRSFVGEDFFKGFALRLNQLPAFDALYRQVMISKVGQGNSISKILEETDRDLQKVGASPKERAQAKAGGIEEITNMISDPKATPEAKKAAVNALYNNSEFELAGNDGVWNRVTSPKTIAGITALGSEEEKLKFSNWVSKATAARLQTPLVDFKEKGIESPNLIGKVEYNSKTYQIDTSGSREPGQTTKRAPFGIDSSVPDTTIAEESIRKINRTLLGYSATAKMMGLGPNEINDTISKYFARSGIDLTKLGYQPPAVTQKPVQ